MFRMEMQITVFGVRKGESSERVGVGTNFHFEKLQHSLYRAGKYETTCILLHESFSSILENYLMILRPDLQLRITLFSRVTVFLP